MDSISFYTTLSSLPNNIKEEIVNYMQYLMDKKKPKKPKNHPQPGCMKGTFKMKSDFDEPLDDFKEYMF